MTDREIIGQFLQFQLQSLSAAWNRIANEAKEDTPSDDKKQDDEDHQEPDAVSGNEDSG